MSKEIVHCTNILFHTTNTKASRVNFSIVSVTQNFYFVQVVESVLKQFYSEKNLHPKLYLFLDTKKV